MESTNLLEQKLKRLIEKGVTKSHTEEMKDYLASVLEEDSYEERTIWKRLKDLDVISPEKGYETLTNALAHVGEMRVKEEAEEIIREIKAAQRRNSLDSRGPAKRPVLKSQPSLDEQDAHKELLGKIARGLDKHHVTRLKDFLHFRHPSHITAKHQEKNMDGLQLLMLMEKVGLLSRGNYVNLLDALDDIRLKKFDKDIEELRVQYLRSDSCSENHPDYPKDLPGIGYVYDMGFKDRSLVDEFKKCGYTQRDKLDDRLKLPFDANLAIVLSEQRYNEQRKIFETPEVERIGKKPVPVVHLVNVHCGELPPRNCLPPVCVRSEHTYAVFLFTCDTTIAEKIWNIFTLYIESPDSIEQSVKNWLLDIQEERIDREAYLVIYASTLIRNLNTNLKVAGRRMSSQFPAP